MTAQCKPLQVREREDEATLAASALADLLELRQQGFRVSLPSCLPEFAEAPDELPLAHEVLANPGRQPTHASRQSVVVAAVTEAHDDLAELEKLGFPVHWA